MYNHDIVLKTNVFVSSCEVWFQTGFCVVDVEFVLLSSSSLSWISLALFNVFIYCFEEEKNVLEFQINLRFKNHSVLLVKLLG